MKAARFDYQAPADVAGAAAALAAGGGGVKVLGGGQSLGPMLNLRLARPAAVLDVSRLEALRRLEDLGDRWRIGGAVTHSALEDTPLAGLAPLAEVARGIAYRAVRNRGTVGGSLAHADPAADWPLVMPALGATLLLAGARGERRVPAAGFMRAAFTTALADDELIAAVEVPKLGAGARWGYWKFCRKTGEFPESSAALLLDPGRRIAELWVGALDGAPQPLVELAADLARRGAIAATPEACFRAIDAAVPGLEPAQRKLHITAVRRAVERALG